MTDAYQQFLGRKAISDPPTGLECLPALPGALFPFQRDIVRWALRRGRAALFAGTGLGKSLMELSWAQAVHRETGRDILLLAPLAVSGQMIREAHKFGISAHHAKSQADCQPGINVTNYQKIDHFDLSKFGGVILDESSILKNANGHYRTRLIDECSQIPFRLAATATPAPNDFMELGNHAEFLGVMSYSDMLATFFVHDGGETQKWRLKGHADTEFWKWMASWAVMLRRPSDLGYEDGAYQLPPLVQHQHVAGVEYAPSVETGMLFPLEAITLKERLNARRDTVSERVAMAAAIVNGSVRDKLAECGSQNTPNAASSEQKRARNTGQSATRKAMGSTRKSGPNTCATTESATQANGTEPPNSMPPSTSVAGNDTLKTPSIASAPNPTPESAPQTSDASNCCETNIGSTPPDTKKSCDAKTGSAPYAVEETAGDGSTSTTATPAAGSEGFYVLHATPESGNSETIPTGSPAPSNTFANHADEPWLIWCGLNTEQDALEKALAGRCISVRGSMTEDEKEAAIIAWLAGEQPIMISKPTILGFGLNFQHCSEMVFVGLNDSFEQVYQAIRRCWRFGQTKPVNVHFVAAETEGAVVANIKRKEQDAERMAAAMVMHMADLSSRAVRGTVREKPAYDPQIPMSIPSWLEAAA